MSTRWHIHTVGLGHVYIRAGYTQIQLWKWLIRIHKTYKPIPPPQDGTSIGSQWPWGRGTRLYGTSMNILFIWPWLWPCMCCAYLKLSWQKRRNRQKERKTPRHNTNGNPCLLMHSNHFLTQYPSLQPKKDVLQGQERPQTAVPRTLKPMTFWCFKDGIYQSNWKDVRENPKWTLRKGKYNDKMMGAIHCTCDLWKQSFFSAPSCVHSLCLIIFQFLPLK